MYRLDPAARDAKEQNLIRANGRIRELEEGMAPAIRQMAAASITPPAGFRWISNPAQIICPHDLRPHLTILVLPHREIRRTICRNFSGGFARGNAEDNV